MTKEELNAVRGYVSNIQAIKDAHNTEQLPINYGTVCTIIANGWKLIEELKALEQYPILDKIRAEIEHAIDYTYDSTDYDKALYNGAYKDGLYEALDIIDKYKAESEET